jgi:ureidoacrylate peracid hydrolase
MEMPAYVVERVMKKRGRLRIFDRFRASETALVVIDMQRFYMEGQPATVAIVPAINRLAADTRAKGGAVAWVSMTAGEGGRSLWPLYHEHFFTRDRGARHRDELTVGAPGHALWNGLDVQPGDIQATKHRFSAFLPGHSDLPDMLRARGIGNVLIAGILTNMCCETSARDAMMLDFKVAMVSDACAALFPEDHDIGFSTVYQRFGDVLTADQAIETLVVPG